MLCLKYLFYQVRKSYSVKYSCQLDEYVTDSTEKIIANVFLVFIQHVALLIPDLALLKLCCFCPTIWELIHCSLVANSIHDRPLNVLTYVGK